MGCILKMIDNEKNLKTIYNFVNTYLSPKSCGFDHIKEFDEEELLGPALDLLNVTQQTLLTHYCDTKVVEKTTNPVMYEKFDKNIEGVKAAKYITRNVLYDASPITHVLAHGSQVDGTFVTGWSDFDVIFIIDLTKLKSPADFIKLRKAVISATSALSFIDPLCHHYFQIIPSCFIQNLSKSMLPPSILSESIFLHDRNDRLLVSYTEEYDPGSLRKIQNLFRTSYADGVMYHHDRNNVYLEDEFRNYKDNMYQLKYFYSLVALLPALYYNQKDLNYSKSDAIDNIKQELKHKIDMSILFDSTNIRRDWGMLKLGKPIDNQVPKYILDSIGKNYFYRATRFIDELCDRV